MSFRTRVLVSITATVILAIWAVAWVISESVTRSFERRHATQTSLAVSRLKRDLAKQGDDIARRLELIAASESIQRLASEPAQAWPDYVNEAQAFARQHALDFLTIAGADGAIISSAHWPARFGYKDLALATSNACTQPAALKREELAEGAALGLMAIRCVKAGDAALLLSGGQRFNQVVNALEADDAVTVSLIEPTVPPPDSRLAALASSVSREGKEVSAQFADETITLIPFQSGKGDVAAMLALRTSHAELMAIRSSIRRTAFTVGAVAVGVGLLLSVWIAARVTQPVRRVAETVRQVAAGDWNARVPNPSRDDIGQLAKDINQMAAELSDQKERMIQSERVAAWRELARRLAHELKNPLFPLQITIENLQRARRLPPGEFDEIFSESTGTLLAEVNNLKAIISRFSDFAKMPAPHFEKVDINQLVSETMKLFDAQLTAPGHPPVEPRVHLDKDVQPIDADPDQLRRALRNLVLNAMDAMPEGGALTVRTMASNGKVAVEVSDTGRGLTPEEADRLFTPYYTTKQHGTGLGLAIVQSVVSDHQGSIAVSSEPGKGATFRIELRREQAAG